MVIVCEHLKLCADVGRLLKVFEMLTGIFQRTVMNAHKLKFAQFVMFYACSLDPEICGLKFAVLLTDIFVSKTESPMSSNEPSLSTVKLHETCGWVVNSCSDAVSPANALQVILHGSGTDRFLALQRMSAVSYLASYLSRAKFISSVMVASILKRLVDWCFEYCQLHSIQEKIVKPEAHRVFYSGFQAAMYVLCLHMRSITDVPNLKSMLFHMPLKFDLVSSFESSKVHEFLRQAKAAKLFSMSVPSLNDNLLESDFSKAFGGIERLDMFFPFDPCLLKESDRFMRPNFGYWFTVKTTYSNRNGEDEDEDLGAPDFADNVGSFEGNDNNDIDGEDDLEYTINNKMSVAPKPAFRYPAAANNFHMPSRMPARISPSGSPTW